MMLLFTVALVMPGKAAEPALPDILLTTQEGTEVRFYSDLIQDKVVAINFIFTSCRMICPILGANFKAVQDLLPGQMGKDIHLISISIDPITDTPARLMAWSQQLGAAPGWTLLTGAKENIDTILKALEVFTADKIDHSSLVLLVNDRTKQWQRVDGLSSAAIISSELKQLLGDT